MPASPDVGRRFDDPTAAGPSTFKTPILAILAIAAGGLGLGLFTTAIMVQRGWDPGRVSIGAWTTLPDLGTTAIDPYAQARLAFTGAMQLAAGEGVSFTAEVDDTGYRLVFGCTYRVSGPIGPTRFWTLAAIEPGGRIIDTAARRTAFSSATVIRDASGAATIEIGPEALPGNWLPAAGTGPMDLVLRFYDTPLADTRSDLAAATLPGITRLSCAASGPASAP